MPSRDDRAIRVSAYLTDETFGYEHWRAAQFSAPKVDKFGALMLFETEKERDDFLAAKTNDGRWSDERLSSAANEEVLELYSQLRWRVAQGGKQWDEMNRIRTELMRRMEK